MTTIEKYDFESVCDYLKEFNRFVSEESDDDINFVFLVTHPYDESSEEMCVISSDRPNLGLMLKHALDSLNDDSNKAFKELIKKLMTPSDN